MKNQHLKAGLLATAAAASVINGHAQSVDALLDKLVDKGVLTQQEAKSLQAESRTNAPAVAPAKSKISDAIKNITLFGDVRFRYEYRSADNVPGSGEPGDTYSRNRFRYAVRVGLRGELLDDFYYGLRLDTSSNPRSPWITFGDDTNPTPSAKTSDGVNIGLAYVGWRPTDWCELTVGKMPMPLYVTSMVWDSDINPEGAVEKFKHTVGNVDLLATFGQFVYQNYNANNTFLLAWQVGGNVNLSQDTSFKIAPVLYTYTGVGTINGLNASFSGQGLNGLNPNTIGYNQNGINDLLVLETPVEYNFKLGKYKARAFGDFAYNFDGNNRAQAAAAVTAPAGNLPVPYTGQNKAYQIGFGLGNLGLVYGQTSKKNTWEARAYWQHVEQYAVDVNLIDSDFFEGRANLEGIYFAFAYSLTDAIITTVRYGHAQPIKNSLGTGGSNPDLPVLNPIKDYNLVQLDLTWRF